MGDGSQMALGPSPVAAPGSCVTLCRLAPELCGFSCPPGCVGQPFCHSHSCIWEQTRLSQSGKFQPLPGSSGGPSDLDTEEGRAHLTGPASHGH